MNEKKIILTEDQFILLMGCLEYCMDADRELIEKFEHNPHYPKELLEVHREELEREKELYEELKNGG